MTLMKNNLKMPFARRLAKQYFSKPNRVVVPTQLTGMGKLCREACRDSDYSNQLANSLVSAPNS
jgi:hypothetical protein